MYARESLRRVYAVGFVNTFKRDYVARMNLRDAQTVLEQLPAAFEHFNEGCIRILR